MKLLLTNPKIDVNIQRVFQNNYLEIVELLLQRKDIDVNLQEFVLLRFWFLFINLFLNKKHS